MDNIDLLFEKVKKVNKFSYSPYSKYQVSAAVLLKNGDIITGVNIENASYSLTICAERCALFSTYSKGYSKDDIDSMMIYTNRKDSYPYPCGSCRQVMVELMDENSKVIIINDIKEPIIKTVKELMPYSFNKESL